MRIDPPIQARTRLIDCDSAIAFGHPLGATGARQIATAFSQAKRTGEKVFCTSMCRSSFIWRS